MVSITDESILKLMITEKVQAPLQLGSIPRGPQTVRSYLSQLPPGGPGFPQVPTCMKRRGAAERKLILKCQHLTRKGPMASEGHSAGVPGKCNPDVAFY